MYRQALLVGLAATVGYAGAALQQRLSSLSAGTIRTNRLEVVDKTGRPRALIGERADGGIELSFYAADGNARARFGLHKGDTPVWDISGDDGQVVATIMPVGSRTAALFINSGSREGVVTVGALGSDADPEPYEWGISVSGTKNQRAYMFIRDSGSLERSTAELHLQNSDGRTLTISPGDR